MTVNYSEYNKVHYPRAEALVSFMKCLHHAMQKTDDYAGAMHQLKCIGYSDEFIAAISEIAEDYKLYHKNRIHAEQTCDLPEVKYPTIDKDRVEQYTKNLQLIEMIFAKENDDVMQNIEDAIAEECEGMRAKNILNAYAAGDVDALICAITGYDLEELLAKAKVIPDTKELFHKTGDFPLSDVTFPFYGKEFLTEEEFREHLRSEYTISPEAWRLIDNIIEYAQNAFKYQEDRQAYLWNMIKGTIGIPEEVVRLVHFED